MPRQAVSTVDETNYHADIEAFNKYMHSGYAHVQNWVANTILQQATGDPDANIAMITVPNRQASFNYDGYLFTILD